MIQTQCNECTYYEYDEYESTYYCTVNLDEDEIAHLIHDSHFQCPYFQHNNEYQIVKKQI